MICQRCNNKEATVHLTKIVNNEKNEVYLCDECAKETGQLSFAGKNPFTFHNLLKGILNPDLSSYEQYQQELNCDFCGRSYRDFTRKGFFGCPQCYHTFSDKLDPIIKRVHGNIRHNGKIPKRKGGSLRIKREIEELRQDMQKAVNNEDFEKAAEIRDNIKKLESVIENGGEENHVSGE